MTRRKSSKRRTLRFLLVLLLIYAATFLVWSRVRTFRIEGESRRVWSFLPLPNGFPALNPARWTKWKRQERIAAMVFWPCVLLDEEFTDRVYWPARFADAPRP